MNSKRIMAVDYGFKRLGIAITDSLRIIATPFKTIKSNKSLTKNASNVVNLARNNNVSTIVLGLPINMDGSSGYMVKIIYSFIKKINIISNINTDVIDERLTTFQTKHILNEIGISKTKYKKNKDQVAAAIILRTYLDKNL
ncbi:MAG: Holliday junction resolvase RuvX [Endomicrobium sp.]|jgi:putative Holliday junction resolvase|nr:Holliday junction resolvase RuvX [Endomicrobium sp.]